METGQAIGVRLDRLAKLQELIHTAASWVAATRGLLAEMRHGLQPVAEHVEALLEEALALGMDMPGMSELEALIARGAAGRAFMRISLFHRSLGWSNGLLVG